MARRTPSPPLGRFFGAFPCTGKLIGAQAIGREQSAAIAAANPTQLVGNETALVGLNAAAA